MADWHYTFPVFPLLRGIQEQCLQREPEAQSMGRQGQGRESPVVLSFLRVGLGAKAAVLSLCIGAEALVGDSKRPLLYVELETSSSRGSCWGTAECGVRPFPGYSSRPSSGAGP